jgi:hypothetical protein
MNLTKRGRGQRRSRRTKNISTDVATKLAWQHIRYNMDSYRFRIPEVLPELSKYYRSSTRS